MKIFFSFIFDLNLPKIYERNKSVSCYAIVFIPIKILPCPRRGAREIKFRVRWTMAAGGLVVGFNHTSDFLQPLDWP